MFDGQFDYTGSTRPRRSSMRNGFKIPHSDGLKKGGWPRNGPVLDDLAKTWAVCPDLSEPESLADYYLASGSIMVLLGKWFCHDCYEAVRSSGDLSGFLEFCKPMTDKELQEGFIAHLLRINRRVMEFKGNSQSSWVCCPHVSQEGMLESLYGTCNPIFFQEGHVTCRECWNILPSVSPYLHTLTECEEMDDDLLQKKVVNQLYPLNYDLLKAVRSY